MSNFIRILFSCSMFVWLPDKSTYTEQSSLPPFLLLLLFSWPPFLHNAPPFFSQEKNLILQPKGNTERCLGTKWKNKTYGFRWEERKTIKARLKSKKKGSNEQISTEDAGRLKCTAYFLFIVLHSFFMERRRRRSLACLTLIYRCLLLPLLSLSPALNCSLCCTDSPEVLINKYLWLQSNPSWLALVFTSFNACLLPSTPCLLLLLQACLFLCIFF